MTHTKCICTEQLKKIEKMVLCFFLGEISCFVLCVVKSVFSFACEFNRSKRKIDETENQKKKQNQRKGNKIEERTFRNFPHQH